MSVVIIDTLKGRSNDNLRELCARNNCEIVIVLLNLTNKFHPLNLRVNKAAEAYFSEKYNNWITIEISKLLK